MGSCFQFILSADVVKAQPPSDSSNLSIFMLLPGVTSLQLTSITKADRSPDLTAKHAPKATVTCDDPDTNIPLLVIGKEKSGSGAVKDDQSRQVPTGMSHAMCRRTTHHLQGWINWKFTYLLFVWGLSEIFSTLHEFHRGRKFHHNRTLQLPRMT